MGRHLAHHPLVYGLVPPFEPVPWHTVTLDADAERCPTMLIPDEQRALVWLARDAFCGSGRIVDAGCFLGGSTVALAQGLIANRRPSAGARPIEVYDLFRVDAFSASAYRDELGGRAEGASTRDLFDAYVTRFARSLHVHEGDILAEKWYGEPIEVFFIDLAKTWGIQDWLFREYFPHLIPGAYVVQQDYLFFGCPWIHVGMEVLADAFVPIGHVGSSLVYRVVRVPAHDELERACALRGDPARCLELFELALQRFAPPERAVVNTAKAVLVAHLLGADAGLRTLARFEADAQLTRKAQITQEQARALIGSPSALAHHRSCLGMMPETASGARERSSLVPE